MPKCRTISVPNITRASEASQEKGNMPKCRTIPIPNITLYLGRAKRAKRKEICLNVALYQCLTLHYIFRASEASQGKEVCLNATLYQCLTLHYIFRASEASQEKGNMPKCRSVPDITRASEARQEEGKCTWLSDEFVHRVWFRHIRKSWRPNPETMEY